MKNLNLSLSRSLRVHSLNAFKKAFFFIRPPELCIFSIIFNSIGFVSRIACTRLDLMEASKHRRGSSVSISRGMQGNAQTQQPIEIEIEIETGAYIYIYIYIVS